MFYTVWNDTIYFYLTTMWHVTEHRAGSGSLNEIRWGEEHVWGFLGKFKIRIFWLHDGTSVWNANGSRQNHFSQHWKWRGKYTLSPCLCQFLQLQKQNKNSACCLSHPPKRQTWTGSKPYFWSRRSNTGGCLHHLLFLHGQQPDFEFAKKNLKRVLLLTLSHSENLVLNSFPKCFFFFFFFLCLPLIN